MPTRRRIRDDLYYLSLPVLLGYSFGSGRGRPSLFAGAEYARLVRGNRTAKYRANGYTEKGGCANLYTKTDVGLVLGGAMDLGRNTSFALEHAWGLSDQTPASRVVFKTVKPSRPRSERYNRALTASLTVLWPI